MVAIYNMGYSMVDFIESILMPMNEKTSNKRENERCFSVFTTHNKQKQETRNISQESSFS